MEKLINVCLHSWINGLPIEYKLFAERWCGICSTLWKFQMRENILKLISDVFFIFYLLSINSKYMTTERINEK